MNLATHPAGKTTSQTGQADPAISTCKLCEETIFSSNLRVWVRGRLIGLVHLPCFNGNPGGLIQIGDPVEGGQRKQGGGKVR